MPELPEVETVRRQLLDRLPIEKTKVHEAFAGEGKLRSGIPDFTVVEGERLTNIRRRAKYLVFQFEEHCLISHLGMSGGWRAERESLRERHDLFGFSVKADGKYRYVFYRDPRRFGGLWLRPNTKSGRSDVLGKLGPEPTKRWTTEMLLSRLKRGNIKQALMDGKVVAGLGNIYAAEVLFRARINPQIRSRDITEKQAARIVRVTYPLLKEAIKRRGSTIRSYRNVDSKPGSAQGLHMVYGREHLPCRRCETLIHAFRQNGRNTFWCPNCQK